jgi:solute carrier family 25 carnitine/acylcarnitine transporter 20/29
MGGGGGDSLQRLEPHQNLVLGMLSGMCSKSVNYPLLVWKNTAQQK